MRVLFEKIEISYFSHYNEAPPPLKVYKSLRVTLDFCTLSAGGGGGLMGNLLEIAAVRSQICL